MQEILTIINRITQIEKEVKEIPRLKAGDPLQSFKYGLSGEKRRLKIRISRLLGKGHTLKDELQLIKLVGGKCAICGNESNPTIDHIIPISKGGHDGIDNLQVLCGSCNSKKGGKYAK